MGSPRQKDTAGSHYHGRHRRRSRGAKDEYKNAKRTTDPAAAQPRATLFTPEQQKVITEHQLITRNQHHASQKTYAHVPCKFFRQGACQAGDSCPFSHSLDASTADQTPCEYYRRGNCKFGARCANAHVLPGDSAVIDDDDDAADGGFFPHDEEFYIPHDFADLLTPEELRRRHSRSSSTTSFSNSSLGASLSSSSASSYTASAASPLLHQQLAYFQPSTKAAAFSPWSPPATHSSRLSFSWLSGDLARLRIDEEEPLVLDDAPRGQPAPAPAHQDTQFLFDDLPDYTRL